MISVQNNMEAWYANRQFQINNKNKAKMAEKLSSGYRINRAADDAAGLAISEKMRKRIRGLAQGTRNGQDGISWVQTGDGALNEADEIMHRMTELAVKSRNDTNSQDDRAAMDAEFEKLKVELDRISDTTTFNELNIFSDHEPTYYECEGGAIWESGQRHVVTAGKNEITFTYRVKEDEAPKQVTFSIPPGEYTTIEILDEFEEVLSKDNGDGTRFVMDYNEGGFINVSLENGESIDSITGNMSYLIYDMYQGGSFGALIGTTVFPSEDARLDIATGMNDEMQFTVEYFKGGRVEQPTIKIPGRDQGYTRQELLDIINQQLQTQLGDDSVRAVAFGTGVKLECQTGIVTGFKGNMFKIDGGDYTSVFYDNVHYGSVKQTAAWFEGGAVLTTDSRDMEHAKLIIDDSNDTLTLRPNGMENSVTLKLDHKEYTMSEMRDHLNTLLKQKGIGETDANGLVVSLRKSESVYLDRSVTFEGLRIDSNLKGPDSAVNIDENSSAYNTLFVTREYNYYGDKAIRINETRPDVDAQYTGGRNLASVSSTAQLTLKSDNNKFSITIEETDAASPTTVEITLAAKAYNSADEIIAEIDNQLKSNAKTKDSIEVSLDDGRIVFKEKTGKGLKSIKVSPSSSSYDTLFRGMTMSFLPTTKSGTGSITFSTDKVTSNTMTISIGGNPVTVTFPSSNPTKEEIQQAIEAQLKASTSYQNITFPKQSDTGTISDRNFSGTRRGSEVVSDWKGEEWGNSDKVEGIVGFSYSNPAVLDIEPKLKDGPMEINSSNNTLRLNLNGTAKEVVLDAGTYNQEQLKDALQNKIDEAFGKSWGGAIVSLKDNQLTLTSRLPDGYDGKKASIQCSTNDSSLLKYLATEKKPAEYSSARMLASDIKIDGSNNEFKCTYEYKDADGKTQRKDVSVTLDAGTYTASSFITHLNTKLSGTGVSASLDNGKLKLTTDRTGSDVSVSYDSRNGGSSGSVIFGELTGASAASIVVPVDIQNSFTVTADKNIFQIFVNGQTQNIELTPGSYDKNKLVTEINKWFADHSVEAKADLSGNRLRLTTTTTGTNAKITAEYDSSSKSAMGAIYGQATMITPGVKADWNGDDITLRVVDGSGNQLNRTISISSSTSGGLLPPIATPNYTDPTSIEGYHSKIYSNVDGVNLSGDVTIDKWNNDLLFTFSDNGTTKNINVVLDDGKYTYAELAEALKNKINNSAIEVTVDASGVRLQAASVGNRYQFSNLDGDFYYKVMCSCEEKTAEQQEKFKDGSQQVEPSAYVVGRRNVLTEKVSIGDNVNDILSLDFTYGGKVHKLVMDLDAGEYQGDSLKKHVQEKLNEALKNAGLKENLIIVGVGGINSGVTGGNDDKALNFRLADDVAAPAEGQVIIDGVSGNAAFDIFYQTDGKMIPAYITGTKDVRDGVTVKAGENDLIFDVDGTKYRIEIDVPADPDTGEATEKFYTAQEFVKQINEKLEAAGAPLAANVNVTDGRLRVSHKEIDAHEIREVSGGAKEAVFFEEHGRKEDVERYVKLSDAVDDKIDLPRSEFSTAVLGIHSVCITRPKYIDKAIDRLKSALGKVAELRSNFGSTQNRLEHALNNNRNAEENMQSSEAAIRDTDMAKQMVAYANQNILEQVGQAMLAQANGKNEIILALLR
ncbi:MAG: hypothetical protein K2O32_10740 [Acetatifactor sp.]|nr:hypothetical protein [Acetatifactor sp.]